jgi:hypothetical protein
VFIGSPVTIRTSRPGQNSEPPRSKFSRKLTECSLKMNECSLKVTECSLKVTECWTKGERMGTPPRDRWHPTSHHIASHHVTSDGRGYLGPCTSSILAVAAFNCTSDMLVYVRHRCQLGSSATCASSLQNSFQLNSQQSLFNILKQLAIEGNSHF